MIFFCSFLPLIKKKPWILWSQLSSSHWCWTTGSLLSKLSVCLCMASPQWPVPVSLAGCLQLGDLVYPDMEPCQAVISVALRNFMAQVSLVPSHSVCIGVHWTC